MNHSDIQKPAASSTSSVRSMLGRPFARLAAIVGTVALFGATSFTAYADRAAPLLECNKGDSDQRFDVGVTMPARAEVGSTYTVQLDGSDSGKISHFGLNYLHDMTVDYRLPAGVAFVDGSAELVPGTGTANVLAGARVWHHGGVVTLTLPGHVAEGTSYTPPSIRFQVRATGAAGSSAPLALQKFRLTANAFLVGEVAVSCEPKSKPGHIGTTLITAPADAPNR